MRISVKDGSVEKLKSLGDQHTRYLSFSPNAHSIVYDLDQAVGDNRRDIHYMSTDGSKETVLVEHPANDWYPFWAKDGKHVIFLSDRTGYKGLWSQQVVNGLPSGDPIQLKGYLEERFQPIGSTKNRSLYYSTGTHIRNIFEEGVDLRTGKRTSPPKKVSVRIEGGNRDPIYSPDGKHLVYLSFRIEGNKTKRFFVIRDVETGKERDISTNLFVGGIDQWFVPRWTPDSKSLLIASIGAKEGVYTVNITSGAHQLIFEDKSLKTKVYFPQMDPEGIDIIYLKGTTKSFYKYNIKNQQHTEIYKSDKQIYLTELSPDGKQLAFTYWFDNPNDLWVISTSGGKPKKVGSIPMDDSIAWPVWTPDGKKYSCYSKKIKKSVSIPC